MARRKEPTVQDLLEQIREAREEGKAELSFTTDSEEVLKEICTVTTLKDLRLSLGKLEHLPPEIGQLTELTSLNLENNSLVSLPDEIGKLTKLERLYCYSNKLTELPESISGLTRLRKAVLWSNELTGLPKGIGKLSRLEELELQWNKIAELPPEIGELSNMEELILSSNQLSDLPREMAGMKKLKRLKLGENQFSSFPEAVTGIPNLQELSLNENQIKELPANIGRMATLEELRLRENQLTVLPAEFFNLNLIVLHLDENQIQELPKEIGKMKRLSELSLRENKLDIPEEILEEGKDAIFEHLGLTEAETFKDSLPPEKKRKELIAKVQERIDQFVRKSKGKIYDEKMLARILEFITGQTNLVPPARLDDHYSFNTITRILEPFGKWTFIDRRILKFIGREAWLFKKPGHDYISGYHEDLFSWFKSQMESEPDDRSFTAVIGMLVELGIEQVPTLKESLREMASSMQREDGTPTSYGRYLVDHGEEHLDLLIEAGARWNSVRNGLVGLLIEHAPTLFSKVAPGILKIEPDEDGEIHIPFGALDKACAVDPRSFEDLLMEGVEKTNCEPCKAEAALILTRHFGDKYAQIAFQIAKDTLKFISAKKNAADRTYRFSWSQAKRYTDGTPEFIDWVLTTFGTDARKSVFEYTDKTKVYDPDIAAVVARRIGQDGIESIAEGLDMRIDSDDLAAHYRKLFTILEPLDFSAYHDKVWEVAQVEYRNVRQTACLALSKLDPKAVVPRAEALLGEKKAHQREAGALILSLIDDKPSRKILSNLLENEKSDDVRDIAVQSLLAESVTLDVKAVKQRVASAAARGKLKKPKAKWLDEAKLPKLTFTKGGKVDPEVVRFLLYRQSRMGEIELDPEARDVFELIDRKGSGDFAKGLLKLVMKNGGPSAKTRFALALTGRLGDDRIIAELEDVAVKKKNENAVKTLGLLGSREAARALDRIMKVFRTKYPNVREAASEAFNHIADGLGKTPFELADEMIPVFGFEGFTRSLPGGDHLEIIINPQAKLEIKDATGKVFKSPPKGVSAANKKMVKELSKEVREAAKQLVSNLEAYLIVQRRWTMDEWKGFFLVHPLAFGLAQSLTWSMKKAEDPAALFRVDAGGALLDVDDKKIRTSKKSSVGLAHPIELSKSELKKWAKIMLAIGPAPFPQLDRPVFQVASDRATKKLSFQFEDREVSGSTFKSRAEKRGWRRGSVVDSGEVSGYYKSYPLNHIDVFVRLSGLGVASWDYDSNCTLKDYFFVKTGSVVTGSYTYDEPNDESDPRLLTMGEVPAIVYSETIGDLTFITHKKK